MGKSPNPCFKLLSCGADSTGVDDELSPAEGKQSSDKRRWSFRKRSSGHQIPSKTVISEPQVVSFDKENPEASTAEVYQVKDSSVSEEPPVNEQSNALAPLASAVVSLENSPSVEQTKEKSPLSSAVNSDIPPVTEQVNKNDDHFTLDIVHLEERVASDNGEVTAAFEEDLQNTAVVIQAAARRFLAQRELQKLKNVVKLQAAMRGHLVRKQAIGTLRCVQAITKLQILVRARRARQCQLPGKCAGQEMNNEGFQTDLVKRNFDLKSTLVNTTTQKLLSNGFARQLLESAPKSKPVHISCDPLRHDSAWQWLERWMAVTSSKVGQQEELDGSIGYQQEVENGKSSHQELDVEPIIGDFRLSGPKSHSNLTDAASQGDHKTDNFGNFESQAASTVSDQCFNSLAEHEKEHSQGEEVIVTNNENFNQTVDGKENPNTGLLFAHNNYPNYTNSETENVIHAAKTSASDPLEAEGRFDLGSRKIRNPAFAAVQAKFEELSSAPTASRSITISRDDAHESKANHSQEVSVEKKDIRSLENLTTKNPIIQVAPSECGTEISISSTLDSPDRSDTDGGEIVLEIESSLEVTRNVDNGVTEAFKLDNMKAKANTLSATSVEFKGKMSNEDDKNMANSVTTVDPIGTEQPSVETIAPGNLNQQENLKAPAYNSSPEGSPRNHATGPESHGTPSSQVSVQSRGSKSQNYNHHVRKPKSKSGTKSLSSNGKNDSDERSSADHLPIEAKNANRWSSFGTAKPDHTDNDSRYSSSNSVPSYMQATESARAKALASASLRSSPDVHDKETHLKKRHSLPIADEKQGSSPRVQRSASQTQQSSKRNNNHSPQSSAERRWQR